jgi:hypothetical protein
VTDQAAGTAGMTLVERPEPQAAIIVRERHAPIDARGRPALSRSAGCVLSDPPGATWETTHGPWH